MSRDYFGHTVHSALQDAIAQLARELVQIENKTPGSMWEHTPNDECIKAYKHIRYAMANARTAAAWLNALDYYLDCDIGIDSFHEYKNRAMDNINQMIDEAVEDEEERLKENEG